MTISLLQTTNGYALDMGLGSCALLWFLLVSVAAVLVSSRGGK